MEDKQNSRKYGVDCVEITVAAISDIIGVCVGHHLRVSN